MREFEGSCKDCKFSEIVKPGDQYSLDGELFVRVGNAFLFRGCSKIDPDKQFVGTEALCVTGEFAKNNQTVPV